MIDAVRRGGQQNRLPLLDYCPDDRDLRFSDVLDRAALEVWIAKSGNSALDRVRYAKPDLILLDVMMPGMDGFETCQQLKADPTTAEIPVIFMTALSDAKDKVKGLDLGAVDYITKPFQQEEVLARVKTQLNLYRLQQLLNLAFRTIVNRRQRYLNSANDNFV